MRAAERLLRNPFDPAQALPKSAEFLRELRTQFGNLGLAAAAYNAGPGRVRDWLVGKRTLPSETQAYVRIVTGQRAEEWRSQSTLATLNVTAPADMPCDKMAAKPPAPSTEVPDKPPLPWGAQLIGDRSELKALAAYRALQKKHEAILGNVQPTIRAALNMGTTSIWTRVRIEVSSRQAPETLCLRLRAAGETCLVQRNIGHVGKVRTFKVRRLCMCREASRRPPRSSSKFPPRLSSKYLPPLGATLVVAPADEGAWTMSLADLVVLP